MEASKRNGKSGGNQVRRRKGGEEDQGATERACCAELAQHTTEAKQGGDDDANPYSKCRSEERGDHAPESKGKRSEECRKFFMSPPWKIFVLCVVSFTPAVGLTWSYPALLDSQGCYGSCRTRSYVLPIWFAIQFVFNFAMSQWRNAGGTQGIKPTFEATGQFEMVLQQQHEGGVASLRYAPNWCEKCKHWKPPRCHHCSICGRCVLRMDHHCPFTGNCIGFNNQGHFVLMYLFGMLGMLYSLSVCSTALIRCFALEEFKLRSLVLRSRNSGGVTGFQGLGLAFFRTLEETLGFSVLAFMALTIVATAAVGLFGVPALHLGFSSRTTLEAKFPMKEYVELQPSVYCPIGPTFYNWGWRQSFRDILGPRWWLRLLVPFPGSPDWHVAVSPRPSPIGEAALTQRWREVKKDGAPRKVTRVEDLGINAGPAAVRDEAAADSLST